VVLNPPNLPCWRNFPLGAETERAFGVPVRVDNDANAAGLAEALWGAAAGYANVFYATLGTGIGNGIVFDRKIYWDAAEAPARAGTPPSTTRGRAAAAASAAASRSCAPARPSPCGARKMAAANPLTKMLDLAGGVVET